MYIEIFTAEFEKPEQAIKNENYPQSGFYIVKLKGGISDFRMIDKTIQNNYCICLESVFKAVTTQIADLPQENKQETEILDALQGKSFDANFILEFSRILLNRK